MAGNKIKWQLIEALRQTPGGAARKQLCGQTGFSWGGVCKAAEELVAAGWLRGVKCPSATPGRPEIRLTFADAGPLTAGLDLGAVKWRFEIRDLAGRVLRRREERACARGGGFPAAAADFTARHLRGSGMKERIIALGIAVSGRIDSRRGVILSAGNQGVPPGSCLPLGSLVERTCGLPALLLPAQAAALWAEYGFGKHAGAANLILIHMGMGISAALLTENRLQLGRPAHPAGHIGHIHLPGNTRPCNCGLTGCIETVAGCQALRRDAAGRGLPENMAELNALALAGNRDAGELFREAASAVCAGAAPLIQLHAPEAVIFSGGQCREESFFYREVLRCLKGSLHREEQPPLELSSLDDFSAALGAARYALEGKVRGTGLD
ncbi:MAG: ROK family protein [Lentisphaeria bacterium]|nr:ROK family protein [Lentisphaeria bacterium]